MKKVFPFHVPGKADARVVEAIKDDVRRYVKRERRKVLPEGATEWTFACRVGSEAATATACTVPELSARIDDVANAGAESVYVEILAAPGQGPSGGSAGR
jgi:hypothetical protein